MIKIYHYPKFDQPNDDETRYTLTDNGGGLISFRVSVIYRKTRKEFEYVLDINANKGKVIELIVHESRDAVVIDPFYVYEYLDKYIDSIHEKGSVKIAKVVIDEELNTFILLCDCHYDIDGFENETIDYENYTPPSYYFNRDCEWFRKKKDFMLKKHSLINNVDVYDSVSYLEAQVDLLTRMVIALSGGNVNEECLELLKTADQYSVLNMKSTESIEKEFTKNKSGFRKKQEKYYETRS